MTKKKHSITFIGAGNVASHLATQFHKTAIDIRQVFSRKISKAKRLAKAVKAEAINDLSLLKENADLYIIAIHDDAIKDVAQQMSQNINHSLVVHTSGAVPSKILAHHFKNYGYFYPLQTFTVGKAVDFTTLPLCIYSPQKRNRLKLDRLAHMICPNIYEINDQQKSTLHVAAVFANNFSNYLYQIAEEITTTAKVDFDILKPLILETALKIQDHTPQHMQTGPAIRGDQKTMDKHLKLLEQHHPEWMRLYNLLSEGISKT